MAFMILYLYLLIQMMMYFVIVGTFYAVFTIFIRTTLPGSECYASFSISASVEFLFLGVLLGILLLSTTVSIDWTDLSFQV